MEKTYTFTVTLDELDFERSRTVLAETGLTAESLFSLILSRTAREGAVPIRKTPAPKRRHHIAGMSGLFVQGNLFSESAQNELSDSSQKDTTLHPTLSTIASLQDAQAMLRWRRRERIATGDRVLTLKPGEALRLIETKQFRIDKAAIVGDPLRPAIIRSLEILFTDITRKKTPAKAVLIDDGKTYYVPLAIEGLAPGSLGLMYEPGEEEVCLIRYGHPSSLLRNPRALE